ncbi:MAG TPA: ABC transporter substrate-binding protein [Methanobacterium sp.]|nr:ABC transporter substrate-binding protein [Methanobacterium sp.]
MKKITGTLIFVVIVLAALGTYNYISTLEDTVIIGYLPSDHHSALFVANEKQLYEKEGIRVQLVPFRAGPEVIEALKEGKIDVGYCGIAPVITAIDNGAPIKIVASVNQEGSGLVVNKNSNITKIGDLKYKTIAIPQKGSVQDVLLENMLKENNISIKDVNIVESEVPYMPRSLLFNKFDAFIAWEPYPSVAKIEENEKVLLYSEDIWNNQPCCVVVTTDNYAKTKSDNLRKILKVHIEATDFINSNKDEAALIVSKKLGTNVEVEKEGLKHVDFIAIPSKDFVKNVLKFVEIQRQLGYIKNNLTEDQLFNLQYIQK